MKVNWQIVLLALIALFTGTVVYTIWSVYNFGPIKAAAREATREWEEATRKRIQEEKVRAERARGAQGMEMFGGSQRDLPKQMVGQQLLESPVQTGGGSGFGLNY